MKLPENIRLNIKIKYIWKINHREMSYKNYKNQSRVYHKKKSKLFKLLSSTCYLRCSLQSLANLLAYWRADGTLTAPSQL